MSIDIAEQISITEYLDQRINTDNLALLLQNGSCVHGLREDTLTPIVKAMAMRRSDIVGILLKFGANPYELSTEQGDTQLHHVVRIAVNTGELLQFQR